MSHDVAVLVMSCLMSCHVMTKEDIITVYAK
jgi:hypothetical protein